MKATQRQQEKQISSYSLLKTNKPLNFSEHYSLQSNVFHKHTLTYTELVVKTTQVLLPLTYHLEKRQNCIHKNNVLIQWGSIFLTLKCQ